VNCARVHKNVGQHCLREIPPEVRAETVFSELKHIEYPVSHVRQLRWKTYNENIQQTNSMFLLLYANMCTVEQNTCNIRDLIGLLHFKVHIEDWTGLRGPFQCYRCQHFGHKAQFRTFTPKCVKYGGNHFSSEY
jgi:hypothetical protein